MPSESELNRRIRIVHYIRQRIMLATKTVDPFRYTPFTDADSHTPSTSNSGEHAMNFSKDLLANFANFIRTKEEEDWEACKQEVNVHITETLISAEVPYGYEINMLKEHVSLEVWYEIRMLRSLPPRQHIRFLDRVIKINVEKVLKDWVNVAPIPRENRRFAASTRCPAGS